jgi:hypothetical protein
VYAWSTIFNSCKHVRGADFEGMSFCASAAYRGGWFIVRKQAQPPSISSYGRFASFYILFCMKDQVSILPLTRKLLESENGVLLK